MGAQGKRVSIEIAVTGASQQGDLPLSLARINQIILTSTASGQTFDFSLENEDGDTVFGPRSIAVPDNNIRPDLLPIGILTAKIESPLPASGTVTVAVITQEK